MATMTALRAHHRGGPEVLVVEQAPVPVPAADEVLIAVHAAAITFDELTWEETWLRDGADRTPTIPSHEVSGVVAGIGDDVTDFAVGDEVYGLIRFDRDGAAAQYVTAPAADLAPRPSSVSHVVAAAVPLAGLTAWQALVDHAAVQSGERVLVHGGAGGVGAFVVQLAVALGAEVTATVRNDDARDVVAAFGARRIIDTRSEPFDGTDDQYDVVIDTIGGALIAAPFIIGLFKDRTFNRFRNEVKKAYQIEVDKKQEGRSLFQGAEQVGKNAFGKEYKNRIPELIQLRSVKEQIAQYGIATGQDKSSLVRQFVNKQKLGDPDDPQNQIVRREFGGPVRRGDTVLVGERRPEILVPGSDGFVFPSIAAYERQLIAALQKRAAGGFFGGAFSKLAGQIEASAFSRSAGGGSATAGGGGNELMMGVLGELAEAVAGLRGIPAGHVVSQGLKENPNLASRALATDMRSSSPESKEILKRAKGYK